MGITRRFNEDGTRYEPRPAGKEGSIQYLDGDRLQKTIKRAAREDGGEPGPGDVCVVHYEGRLADGTLFDSSRKKRKPFKFTLGQHEVIQGWDVAVTTMREGEMIELRCAPAYAYGSRGSPPSIPPDATLTFEIELLEFSTPSLGDIALSKWPSWRCHSLTTRASQAASEGGLPSALRRRGPSPWMPRRCSHPGATTNQTDRFYCV